eukprot:474070-Hanusia_phi.AAC.1
MTSLPRRARRRPRSPRRSPACAACRAGGGDPSRRDHPLLLQCCMTETVRVISVIRTSPIVPELPAALIFS